MSVVKVCGLRRESDAIDAVTLGADLLGMVFYRRSPRAIGETEAASLVKTVRRLHADARFLGVFVDEPVESILRIAATLNLYGIQLHGDEPSEVVHRLGEAGLFVIKAHRIGARSDLSRVGTYGANADLLDTHVPGLPGGTGTAFDWSLASDRTSSQPILLAGGLTPDNVEDAICTVRPWGVDVSSGIECEPGIKDFRKMQRFIESARAAFAREVSDDAR